MLEKRKQRAQYFQCLRENAIRRLTLNGYQIENRFFTFNASIFICRKRTSNSKKIDFN